MKNSKTFKDDELSESVLASMNEIITRSIDALLTDYSKQLEENGKRLDQGDFVILRTAVRKEKLTVTMTISTSVDAKLLEAYNCYPIALKQSTFDNVESGTVVVDGDDE